MGGGDLNTKKSWHPNTMKNQERVWKAEQAVAEEKKRILELQREREEERDRTQLREMAQRNFGPNSNGDNRLHWMYDKPDKQAQQEDYLLGKAIGKSNEADNAPQNAIPALSRRVVGSSMTTTGDDSQVDLARKLREDPLLLVKERERAARAALLNNPLQRKKLTELLRKEQKQKESKTKKKSKKKEKDLDDVLAAKLNALAGKKGINITSLLNSEDSDSDSSSSDEKSKKKKKKNKRKHDKKSKKSKKKLISSESGTESSDNYEDTKKSKVASNHTKAHKNTFEFRKRKSNDTSDCDGETKTKKSRQDFERNFNAHESCNYKRKDSIIQENTSRKNLRDKYLGDNKQDRHINERDKQYRGSPPRRIGQRGLSPESPRKDRKVSPSKKKYDEGRGNTRKGLSEKEKAARLAEMAAAGAEREVERGLRVAQQLAEESSAPRNSRTTRQEARALPDSLESRIRSNRHYIQRDRTHMNEHFARR